RVFNNLPPAGTVIVRSPLISMDTSPLLTSLDQAIRIMATSVKTMAVNIPTPRMISLFISYSSCLQLHAGERHEPQGHESHGDEGDTKTTQAVRHIAVLEFLANTCQRDNRQRPADTRTKAIRHTFTKVVITFHHEQGCTHDGA